MNSKDATQVTPLFMVAGILFFNHVGNDYYIQISNLQLKTLMKDIRQKKVDLHQALAVYLSALKAHLQELPTDQARLATLKEPICLLYQETLSIDTRPSYERFMDTLPIYQNKQFSKSKTYTLSGYCACFADIQAFKMMVDTYRDTLTEPALLRKFIIEEQGVEHKTGIQSATMVDTILYNRPLFGRDSDDYDYCSEKGKGIYTNKLAIMEYLASVFNFSPNPKQIDMFHNALPATRNFAEKESEFYRSIRTQFGWLLDDLKLKPADFEQANKAISI